MIKKINLSTTLIALVLFLLPWLEVQCSGVKFASQSGVQTVVGAASGLEEAEAMTGDDFADVDMEESAGFAWLIGLALLVVVAAVAMAFVALRVHGDKADRTVGILCMVALLLITAQMAIGFPVHHAIDAALSEQTASSGGAGEPFDEMEASIAAAVKMAIQVKYLPALYLELLMLALPALVVANALVDKLKREPEGRDTAAH
jgi:hypothetical protein